MNLYNKLLHNVTYDVNNTLSKQQLEKQITIKISKTVLKQIELLKNELNQQQVDQMCDKMFHTLQYAYTQILQTCKTMGIIVNFIGSPAFQVLEDEQFKLAVPTTRLIQSIPEYMKMLSQQGTFQLFIYQLPIFSNFQNNE